MYCPGATSFGGKEMPFEGNCNGWGTRLNVLSWGYQLHPPQYLITDLEHLLLKKTSLSNYLEMFHD